MGTNIAQQLRELRKARGVSIRKLAELAETSPATVVNYEQNRHGLTTTLAERIARILGARIEIKCED